MTPGMVCVLAAAGINAAYTVRQKKNPVPVLVGGTVLLFFVAAFDAADESAGTALGGTFLLGTLVYRGRDFFDLIAGLTSQQNGSTPPKGGTISA
jgi:hypothetical protein